MPRRIDIELTSALADDSWTWRAAGAKKPNGVVAGSILPAGAKVGDVLKVEMEQMLDGVEILSVVKGREKQERANVLELLPTSEPFQEVIETRAQRGRDNRGRSAVATGTVPVGTVTTVRAATARRGRRRQGRRRPRRPRSSAAAEPAALRSAARGSPAPEAEAATPGQGPPQRGARGDPRRAASRSPNSSARAWRPFAHGSRKRTRSSRPRASPTMPEASVVKMAEDLLPKLRVAEWLDRAEAAQRQMDHLDLRDLRSVIIAGDDSIVARDETAVALNIELKASLVRRQAEELQLWIEDIDASLGVGRVIRALRLSSQPPKAGVMFPPELARRLGEAATQALQPDDTADRWIAVLEAAAFSPVRSLVQPTGAPTTVTDDLRATALRLGPGAPADRRAARRRDPGGRPSAEAAAPHGSPRRQAEAGRQAAPAGRAAAGGKPAGSSGERPHRHADRSRARGST